MELDKLEKIDEFKKKGRIEMYGQKLCLCDPKFKKCDKKKTSKIKWDKISIKDAFELKKSLENSGTYSNYKSGIDVCLTDDFKTCSLDSLELVEKFSDFNKRLRNVIILLIFFIFIILFMLFR